jgi:hypothetical protein
MPVVPKAEEVIEQWMLAVVSDGGVRRFDDLHIDKIDPKWKNKNQLIESGLEAFRIAVDARNRNHLQFAVSLGFSLDSDDQPRGVDFQTQAEFRARLDLPPPSLYLFERGNEPRAQSGLAALQDIDPAMLGMQEGTRCYYLEFKQNGSDEYRRSVFVEG